MKPEKWAWKDPCRQLNGELRLKYEPGGWGDILKGEWVAEVVATLLQDPRHESMIYLDPFCGARSYPATAAAQQRLRQSGSGRYLELQAGWLERGQLASSASLVRQQCEAVGRLFQPHLGEADPRRRQSWAEVRLEDQGPGTLLERVQQADLLLWDPYDFHLHWREWLPRLQERAPGGVVLIYLFNKSPQGADQLRHYKEMLKSLQGQPYWLGRLAADAVLPRAYHEMILLGNSRLTPDCGQRLQALTRNLAIRQAGLGCWSSND